VIGRALRTVVVIELLAAGAIAAWLAAGHDWSIAAAFAGGLATPLALHAGIVGLNFGLATFAGSPTPPAHRLGAASALRLYLREVVDSLRAYQFAMPWQDGRALPGEDARGGAAIPVVLVHGYLCNRQIWRPFARWLAGRGHPLAGVDLDPVFGPIDGYAPQLARAVDALRSRTGAERVALVCHSMGGLVARAYLRAYPQAPVACVVTLGTPHRGTVHARFGQGENAAQMRPGSDWLRELAAGEDAALRRRFTVVLSHHDNIVAPQAVQTLPEARLVELSGLGHLTLAVHPRVWQATAAALDDCDAGQRPGDPR